MIAFEPTAAILAGGQGTRLQSVVNDRPKPLAKIRGRPFLSYLLDFIIQAGVRDVVLCTGYRADLIEAEFGSEYKSAGLRYSREEEPLGTGGALRKALPLLRSKSCVVFNGDSFFECELPLLFRKHEEAGARATVYLTEVPDAGRYGRVRIDGQGEIISFEEKGKSGGPGLINAGIYTLDRKALASIPPDSKVSLENEVFPSLVGNGLLGVVGSGRFIDIGTPGSYALAQSFFGQNE